MLNNISMKKAFLFIILSFLIFPCLSYADDGWEEFSGVDRAWDGQKSVTNKEFEEAIDALEGNKKKKEEKQRKKLIKKIGGGGTSLHPDLSPDSNIQELNQLSKNEDGTLLNVPVNLVIDDNTLEKGFYNVIAQKDELGDIYLLFYQAHFLKGKVKAQKTDDDYGEEYIYFVKLMPYDNNFVKIIFGSLDFNAYTFVRFVN